MFDYDLFVIGGGSGGVRAARLAAQAGFRVAIAEQSRMGGTCVIRGCVPKKLMVNAADFSDSFRDSVGFGWSVGKSRFNWTQFRHAKDREISRLSGLYRDNLTKAGVTIFPERAVFEDAHSLRLSDGQKKSAKTILVATGGRPYLPQLPNIGLAATSDDMFLLDELPQRILVVGGGYIACEFSTILNGLGCEVTQYYRGDLILRGFDGDIRTHVKQAMVARGVIIQTGRDPRRLEESGGEIAVIDNRGDTRQFDLVLYATGRQPMTEGLGLEEIGIARGARGEIPVDAYSQSAVPSVFAIGDVTNRVNLTPVAIREAVAFVETLFKANSTPVDHDLIPTAVFTRPEIGTVGLSEEVARDRGHSLEIYKTTFRPLAAVIAERNEQILMKLVVCARTRRVLGAHMAGPHAAEMIQLAGIAVKMGATKDDFDRTVAVHPTAAEEWVTMAEPVALN